jgi:hypothetical protein
MSHGEILKTVARAVSSVITKERTLFEVDVTERSLTHKLGEHLQHAFPDWNVDCEYHI